MSCFLTVLAHKEVTVPPIGPDELPPPYSATSPGNIPTINCKVCQSLINIEGKTSQHVVKCSVCNEATVWSALHLFLDVAGDKMIEQSINKI